MKILIACPTLGLEKDPRRWLKSFTSTFSELLRNHEVGLSFPYRVPPPKFDNMIVKEGIDKGYDYILRMDDDIWGVPPGSATRLLEADKEFIGAVMYTHGFPYAQCAMLKRPEDKDLSIIDIARRGKFGLLEAQGTGIVPVALISCAFVLWKVSMFSKLTEPYFDCYDGVPTDSVFCQRCLDAGIQPYAHLDIKVCHRAVTPFNKDYLFTADINYFIQTKKIYQPEYRELLEFVKRKIPDLKLEEGESGAGGELSDNS